jgi:DNA-binding NtrC family response regulator
MRFPILVADDDSLVLRSTELLLQQNGFVFESATSGDEAIQLVTEKPDYFAVALIDYRMDGKSGSETVSALLAACPKLYILIYSGDDSREAIQSTWQAGAVGFIEKGSSAQRLLEELNSWCAKYAETHAVIESAGVRGASGDFIESLGMVGRSEALREVARKVERYRGESRNVLLLGETGTGKELIAKALHDGSKGEFIAVNCAVYRGTTELLESELFGHERGAFTGADKEKKGIFESAAGGTVFLDEVCCVSLSAQAKLLRVCQEKKIRRVGGTSEYAVDFRLITASKPDIEKKSETGEFLADLFHRLNVLAITIPPLSQRTEDIEPLARFFCKKHQGSTGEKKTLKLKTVRYLEKYGWPGNVRELENTIYRLLTDSNAKEVGPEGLDAKFFSPAPAFGTLTYEAIKERQKKEERDYITRLLAASKSKQQVAQRLGVSPTTLHSIMQRVGLYPISPE